MTDHDHRKYALNNHDHGHTHWLLWLMVIVAIASKGS